jgi:hypothetical protein
MRHEAEYMTTSSDPYEWIPVPAIPAHVPGRPHICTIQRWINRGVRGRKLPSTLFGGRRFVHRDDLALFLSSDSTAGSDRDQSRTASLLRAQAAREQLQAMGVPLAKEGGAMKRPR